MKTSTCIAAALTAMVATTAAAEGVLNLYSSRHYDTDERLYSDFEAATGITINRIEGNADELIARMQAEGQNSPADILLTVDSTRLERAKAAGLFQPIDSAILEERIPASLQDADNQWFGFSQRARVLFYDKADVTEPPMTYADLADPKYKGMVCIRSSTNVYSQSILSALIEHLGEEAAKEWAAGVVANFARAPQGGDTDQLRGIVSGECDIAMSNTYYFGRALRTPVDGVSEKIDMFGWVFPDQAGNGTHVNISGGGVAAYAPNRENAIKFLEYLASDQAQDYFSAGNDEYPVVVGAPIAEHVKGLGEFKADDISLSLVAKNLAAAQRIFNEVGWE
ncbi:MAG: Fe(3+) ABC transporter substrate-binding protein [Rhodobacteraceae bacterium]|nr:MAG: Fe(3+) ABC transporter substrate-binding protein [Paracoccaceae bacterium]